MGQAAAYLITFSCYGTWMHGAESGSVDRHHHIRGSPLLAPNPGRSTREASLMTDLPFQLSAFDRGLVLAAIAEVCRHRDWALVATHVRSTHVHVVVQGATSPERMMQAFKAYASRKLGTRRKRWTRHGSTRYLWNEDDVKAAVRYVLEGQGKPMATYCAGAAPC
jgi:REP element-mobilizing transposase RayT